MSTRLAPTSSSSTRPGATLADVTLLTARIKHLDENFRICSVAHAALGGVQDILGHARTLRATAGRSGCSPARPRCTLTDLCGAGIVTAMQLHVETGGPWVPHRSRVRPGAAPHGSPFRPAKATAQPVARDGP